MGPVVQYIVYTFCRKIYQDPRAYNKFQRLGNREP